MSEGNIESSREAFLLDLRQREAEERITLQVLLEVCPKSEQTCRVCYFGGPLSVERMVCPVLNGTIETNE